MFEFCIQIYSYANRFSSVRSKVTAASLLVALGIIYGDIGTSPLYVLKAIVGEKDIDEMLVFGGISCVFWTLTLQTTIKYIWLTLKADNDGEGGIFSLYALVRRYGKYLAVPTILGATTLLADGIITPPISVASAIEGLTIIEGLQDLPTVPIVIVILSVLFFFQRFGTQKWGAFGPIMVIWFGMLAILGAAQLVHYPSVLQAIHPKYALDLLIKYPHGFWLLGAVFWLLPAQKPSILIWGTVAGTTSGLPGSLSKFACCSIILVNRPGCCTVRATSSMVEIHF